LAVSTTSKSPKDILLTALSVGQAKLANYSHRNSPKKFTQPQLFACLVLKTSLGLDYRGLEGLLDDSADLCQLIGLESVPHYTTFQKASRKLLVNSLVQALLDETVTRALGRRKTVKHAAIDSTGLECSAASNYFVKRRDRVENPWKTVTYSHYPKLAIVCRTDDHFILAFASRRGPKPDVDEFKELVSMAARRVKLRCIVADAGYDSESNHRFARESLASRSIFPAKHGRPTTKPATGKYRGRKGVRNRFGKNSFSVPDTFSCSRHSWSQAQGPGATLAELETGVSVKQMIERVPLGARVPALNPLRWDYDSTFAEPEESSWAKLTLVMRKRDGGVVDAELLRPRAWIEAAGIAVGKPLPLNLPELNIRDEVSVMAIEACPPIASGAGSSVQFRGPGGELETLTGTELHPIWSVDRADWIPLSQLQPGERLLCSDASTSWDGESERGQAHAFVLGVTLSTVCEPVYNLEIHGEHVYQVGELGVLVHNAGADNYDVLRNAPRSAAKDIDGYRVGSHREVGSHHIIQGAAVRELPGYNHGAAIAVDLGSIFDPNSAHRLTRPAPRLPGGGTYAAERRFAYRSLRDAGVPRETAKKLVREADGYFASIGVTMTTRTRIPGDR
jgi:hypothetical protein